uniref:E1A-binding protein p400 n=1 Tax=Parastrongyloides trichosuri TaxID=131310 RepID=A0A0N4Z809_PARTI
MRNININSKTPCADIKLCMDEWQEEHDRLCREIREARENRDRAKREARYLDSLSITLANELNVLKNPPLVAVPEILNEEEIEWVENSPSPSTVKVPSLPDVEPTPSPAVERVPSSPAVEIPPATTVEEAVGLTNPLECQTPEVGHR